MRQRLLAPPSLVFQTLCIVIAGCSEGDAGLSPTFDVGPDGATASDVSSDTSTDARDDIADESDVALLDASADDVDPGEDAASEDVGDLDSGDVDTGDVATGDVATGDVGTVCEPGATLPCYDGPEGTEGVGACAEGLATCAPDGSAFGPCVGAVTPTDETCLTLVDDDCDGEVNESGEGCVCVPGDTAPCYSGPEGTSEVGPCAPGSQTCNPSGTGYEDCTGDVTPKDESCLTDIDDDCDGEVNESGEGCVCVPGSSAPCYTGPEGTAGVGRCALGSHTCNTLGTDYDACTGDVTPATEDCTTPTDDDCDGTTADADAGCICEPGSVSGCYDGAAGTENVGACAAGQRSCNAEGTGYGPCAGQVTPVAEDCATEADDDCDGTANEADAACACAPGGVYSCYDGPGGTAGVGACAAGQWVCNADGKGFGPCEGDVTPSDEDCATADDDDCDGTANEADAGCVCDPGSVAGCYGGPAGTEGVGACAAGQWTCEADGKGYGACGGDITPMSEDCATPIDDDCDGTANEADAGCVCDPGSVAACYTGPAVTDGVGACAAGMWTCEADGKSYGACQGEVLPVDETCTTPIDDDCNGSTFCPGAGESCTRPLYPEDGVLLEGLLTFVLEADAATSSEGPFACDTTGSGPDVAIEVTKTSPSVANGGKLLRVTASSAVATTGGYLNLAVTQGPCQLGVVEPLKCLWYSQNWSAYIDGEPGTYTVWVAKNSVGAFTGATVTIAEVDPAAGEGEGCFAPYTTASANYTAPDAVDSAHRWTLPAGLRSFDMGATWGEPQSISCDDTAPYGDIHGADAVIEGVKAQESTVLLVEVQNAGTTGSDLNAELLDQCDPTVPNKVSRACSANADAHAFTAKPPVGPFYLWVSTEATGEPFEGASVRVTEFTAGPGGTRHTAQPLPSGTVTGTSAVAYDKPSCFGAGNVHWYAITMTSDTVGLRASTAVAVAIVTADGNEVACQTDASALRFGYRGSPGTVLQIAIPSGQTTTLDVVHGDYDGISGEGEDVGVVWSDSATSEYGMAIRGGTLYMGSTTTIHEIDLATGAAISRGATEGITTTHLGYDLLVAGGQLFSVDSATSTTASRLFRVFDGNQWGPTAWDLAPSYPASSPLHAIASDGASGFAVTRSSTSATFYQFALSAAGAPVLLGQTTNLVNASGLAVDSQFFYVAATRAGVRGLYRVGRNAITDAATLLATPGLNTLRAPLALDSLIAPKTLYARDADGDIVAVANPASAAPVALGAVVTLSTSSDFALTYDHDGGALYYFESESDSAGRIRKLVAP